MTMLLTFIAGVIVGGVIMYFVYRKNAAKFAKKEKELLETINRIKSTGIHPK